MAIDIVDIRHWVFRFWLGSKEGMLDEIEQLDKRDCMYAITRIHQRLQGADRETLDRMLKDRMKQGHPGPGGSGAECPERNQDDTR